VNDQEAKGADMEDTMDDIRALPGFTRGHPHYYPEPVIDHLLEIVLQLGAEIWVNRDRQFVMETLLASEGKVTADMIDAFEPSEAFTRRLSEERKAFTERVYGCLYGDLNKQSRGGEFVPGVISKKDT
jgi:hypothetical protein